MPCMNGRDSRYRFYVCERAISDLIVPGNYSTWKTVKKSRTYWQQCSENPYVSIGICILLISITQKIQNVMQNIKHIFTE